MLIYSVTKYLSRLGRHPCEKIAAPLQENLFLFEKSYQSTLFVYKSKSLILLLWVDVWLFNGGLENCFMRGYIPLGYVFVFRFRPPFWSPVGNKESLWLIMYCTNMSECHNRETVIMLCKWKYLYWPFLCSFKSKKK